MVQLVWHIAGVARHYPMHTFCLEHAHFRQHRLCRRAFTPPYANTPWRYCRGHHHDASSGQAHDDGVSFLASN